MSFFRPLPPGVSFQQLMELQGARPAIVIARALLPFVSTVKRKGFRGSPLFGDVFQAAQRLGPKRAGFDLEGAILRRFGMTPRYFPTTESAARETLELAERIWLQRSVRGGSGLMTVLPVISVLGAAFTGGASLAGLAGTAAAVADEIRAARAAAKERRNLTRV